MRLALALALVVAALAVLAAPALAQTHSPTRSPTHKPSLAPTTIAAFSTPVTQGVGGAGFALALLGVGVVAGYF